MGPLIAAIVLAVVALLTAVVALRRAGPPLPPEPTPEERERTRDDLHRIFGGKP